MFLFDKTKNVADYIVYKLNEEGLEITHLKLQKLLYFSQKESLKSNNIPLFEDDFEAWVHGPVIPKIYKFYACYGWNNIPANYFKPILFQQDKTIIKKVLDKFKCFAGRELEDLSHDEIPWINARKGLLFSSPSNKIITKESIRTL
ncbi:MAG: Panacea domain-containing protein [Fusobacteriaceae bacterium]